MSPDTSAGVEPDGDRIDGWPARLSGVTETVVATEGPEGRWNQAALGISPAGDGADALDEGSDAAVTARTFGRTRTRVNFSAGRGAYVQFTTDSLDFASAALDVHETDAPILASADAWTQVAVEPRGDDRDRSTPVQRWTIVPIESGVRDRSVTPISRGRAAVIEATVAASRLDVDAYDTEALLDRLEWLSDVVETCGGERDLAAFELIDDVTRWRDR